MAALSNVAPAFVKMAHEIVWCTAPLPCTTPDLAMGRRQAHRLDRYRPHAHQARSPGGQSFHFLQLLGAHTGHLRSRVPRRVGL